MPSYNVTGKLGGGKTLFAVHQAFERLQKGLIVASNIDLFPERVLSPWHDAKRVRLLRIPDHPDRADLDMLGMGNTSSDETKNGLLILDEAGTMLNARSFKAEGRQDLINWFLHARKLGWDLMFISQSHAMIDKQIRDALIEYLVVVRRFDRYRIPFLTWLGIKVNMPRIHFAIVRYGNTPQALVSERIFFRGNNLFDAYSTRQLVLGESAGLHSVLSPWHLKGRHMTHFQIAKVAAKAAWVAGLALGVLVTMGYGKYAGYRKPDVGVVDLAKLPVASIIKQPNGSFLVLRPDGKTELSTSIRSDQAGTIVTTATGQFKVQP